MISFITRHKVAANLLMIMMLLSGAFALSKINFQFFPTFGLDYVSVSVVWPGASAEDLESSVTTLLEKNISSIDRIKNLTSASSNNLSLIFVEFEEGVDMAEMLDKVKTEVSKVTNLPADSKEPKVKRLVNYETVSKIVVSTDGSLEELRTLVKSYEQDLLSRGVTKVEISGLPDREIAIEVPLESSMNLGMEISTIARKINAMSQDQPAGVFGDLDATKNLRAKEQRRNPSDFEDILVKANKKGQFVKLGQIAKVSMRNKSDQVLLMHNNRPAVELNIQDIAGVSDTLASAEIITKWLEDTKKVLPPTVHIKVYYEKWKLVSGRLNLLLKNGAGGLVLVCLILFLFLNGRVAFWVAMGIPVSFMATIAILYALGGSINMISMFALIMALGIIVDDAIVVGEDAFSKYQSGTISSLAAEQGANRMLAPVVSSSLTTIATFLPLTMISGIVGKILYDIPLIIICVIIASLVESFFVLPGHLRHSMRNLQVGKVHPVRNKLDNAFNHFRDVTFKKLAIWSINNKRITLTTTFAMLILGIALLAGGRVPFAFFPMSGGSTIKASVGFSSGTNKEDVRKFTVALNESLKEVEKDLGSKIVDITLVKLGYYGDQREGTVQIGDNFATVIVELIDSDKRDISDTEVIKYWLKKVKLISGVETFSISAVRGGPPGKDLELRLVGGSAATLKKAAEEVASYLEKIPGVLSLKDDLPYGREQLVFTLTPEALALGLSVNQISTQLNNAFSGLVIQRYMDRDDEIDVRIMLPKEQRLRLSGLESMMIFLPDGKPVLLSNLVDYKIIRGFDTLRHADNQLSVTIRTDLDSKIVVAGNIIEKMKSGFLVYLTEKYNISASFEGKNADESQTKIDMLVGVVLAIILMYIILTWVFSSYFWPLIIMSAIPFGLAGAIFGHWLLGINMTILSIFGLFGLSGIVVNDSIVLVTFYKELRQQEMPVKEAVVTAVQMRLRAVLLTSLTTILGLTPLVFETSLQAQFLIPMAVSIIFGLAFSTFVILLYIPAFLAAYEIMREKYFNRKNNLIIGDNNA